MEEDCARKGEKVILLYGFPLSDLLLPALPLFPLFPPALLSLRPPLNLFPGCAFRGEEGRNGR